MIWRYIFESDLDMNKLDYFFREYDALALTFESNMEKYSYLQIKDNLVINAAEKKVISNRASAGVYFYKILLISSRLSVM